MPRSPDGTYSLPLADVAPGETISSTWANSTMNDIAASISDSLDRDGNGGMRAPLLFGDGAEGVPGIAWSNEPSSGFYRPGTGIIGISVLGSDVIRVAAAGTTFTGYMVAETVTADSIAVESITATGAVTALSLEAATITSTGDITATGVISGPEIDVVDLAVTGVATIAAIDDLNVTGSVTYGTSEITDPTSISAANGALQEWTLENSITLTDDLVNGQEIWVAFMVTAGYNSGGGTITWPPAMWGSGGAPQPTNDGYTLRLYKVGGTLYGIANQTN